MPLTDRQRVEIMLPAQVLLGVLIAGVDDPNHPDAIATRDALIRASNEVVADLPERHVNKIIARMFRVHNLVTEPYRQEGARVDKMGLIAFYWLKALTDCEYLVLHEGSNMQKALDRMLPALEQAANIAKLDASAQKQSKKFLQHLQSLGYYSSVTLPG